MKKIIKQKSRIHQVYLLTKSRNFLLRIIVTTIILLLIVPLNAEKTETDERKIYLTLKFGQGGFNDSRSPLDKLGGGEVALVLQHRDYPIAISLAGEYYTNSPAPQNSYEISDMTIINGFYSKYFLNKKKLQIFGGPGVGVMTVPQLDEKSVNSILFNWVGGVNYRLIWKIGLYGTYKYLYAQKDDRVDFSEHIFMIGISFNFRLF